MAARKTKRLLALSAAVAGVGLFAGKSKANLTWDTAGSGNSVHGGAGTWDYATTNWFNGTNFVAWDNTVATFGGATSTGGIVTIQTGTGVLAQGLVFAPLLDGTSFTINGNAPTDVITLGSAGIVV